MRPGVLHSHNGTLSAHVSPAPGAHTKVFGLCATRVHAQWNISLVRCVVDGGLLGVILLSIFVRRPFTLEYARERVAPAVYNSPPLIRQNYIVTAVWTASMAIIVLADLALHFMLRFPVWGGGIAIAAAFTRAPVFTRWYPQRENKHRIREQD